MAYAQEQIYTLVKYDEKVRKSPANIQNVVYYNKYGTINQWGSWQTDGLAGQIGKGGSLHGEK